MFNTDLLAGVTIASAATVPIILSIVQVIKMTGWIDAKYAPIVSIVVGILVAFLLGQDTNSISGNILSGILFGLAASGLYSGVETTSHAIKADKAEKLQKQAANKK